jgi:hypothetical protein
LILPLRCSSTGFERSPCRAPDPVRVKFHGRIPWSVGKIKSVARVATVTISTGVDASASDPRWASLGGPCGRDVRGRRRSRRETTPAGGSRHSAEIGVCGTCMDARGIAETELAEGTKVKHARGAHQLDPVGRQDAGVLMSTPETVVILGGDIGGLRRCSRASEPTPRQHRVMLVDHGRGHLFAASLLWLMVGLRDPASIRRPLKRFERKGIEIRPSGSRDRS